MFLSLFFHSVYSVDNFVNVSIYNGNNYYQLVVSRHRERSKISLFISAAGRSQPVDKHSSKLWLFSPQSLRLKT
jgi:hypothetical protein